MGSINSITAEATPQAQEQDPSPIQVSGRRGMWAPPRHGALNPPQRTIPLLFTGTNHAMRASRLGALASFAPLVQVNDGMGVLSGEDEPGLAFLADMRIARQTPSSTMAQAVFVPLGGLNRFRGRMELQVRTVENAWSEPGLTRVLLPAGSTGVSETEASDLVTTPANNGTSDNWGNQDGAYIANEVATGFITWDWAEDWYTNQVQVTWDPLVDAIRSEKPALTSTTERVRATHNRGWIDLLPATGKVTINDNSVERTVSIDSFSRWTLTRWTGELAEFYLGDGLYIIVHQNGLMRWVKPVARVSFDAATNDVTADEASEAIDGASWRVAATEAFDVTSDVLTVASDGDAMIYNGTATDGRVLFKDVRVSLGVVAL